MKVLSFSEIELVSGGAIGAGSTSNGIPLLDAAATRLPGEGAWGAELPQTSSSLVGQLMEAAGTAVTRVVGDCANGAQLGQLAGGARGAVVGCLTNAAAGIVRDIGAAMQ